MLAGRLKGLGKMQRLGGLIQELGTPEQKVFFWVEQGEFDGAITRVIVSNSKATGKNCTGGPIL